MKILNKWEMLKRAEVNMQAKSQIKILMSEIDFLCFFVLTLSGTCWVEFVLFVDGLL